MQAAIAGAGIERHIRDIEGAQRIRDDVAAKTGGVDASGRRSLERRGMSIGGNAGTVGRQSFLSLARRLGPALLLVIRLGPAIRNDKMRNQRDIVA
jgi:hypothetical protein